VFCLQDSSADDDESSVSLDSQSESELEDGSPENGSDLEAAETESSLDEVNYVLFLMTLRA